VSLQYEHHRPERPLLYQRFEKYYPAFDARWAAEGMLGEEMHLNSMRRDAFLGLDRTLDLAPPGNPPLNLSAA
jgi:hypothetical protein